MNKTGKLDIHKTMSASPIAKDAGRVDLFVLVVLSALMAFASISTDTYLPAFPTISAAFQVDPGRIQLTLSSYLIGFSVGQLIWGPIGDRYGRRKPIAVGMILFMIGSGGCALSGTAEQMIGWRVIQALGACSGPVLARAMVRDLYARERSAQMLSTLMLVMGVAPLLGPLLGGQILALWSWQAIFWCLVGFGILALIGVLALPETLAASRRSAQGLAEVWINYLTLVRNPRLLGYAAAGGFYYGGAYAYIAGTPFAYIDYYHVPPQAYGLLFGLNIVGMMGANFLNSRLVMRLGSDRIFHFGAGIAALSGVMTALDARFGWGGLVGLVLPLFFFFSVSGFIVANSVAGALAAFPRNAGAASAVVGATHYGSGIFSAAALGWFADGTPWTMGWIIGVTGLGSLGAALFLVRPVRTE
ncbi:Bcr/CflA family multidrug efflux MFS transporter [Telmatospirillum siberiense]|uniref:Bcr/CflA family efflux transporter n=1 Tax=Telmatospirillum siberiense TaxID=382514 RepID=A0A2N3PWM8_9PROT|nr:Bcr/CflA family multidrug efflux MFS transporter [Telmatospirillum siberiense]PKU24791.1 Bcr/CflA family drug resistance efflux transporter [Telmatospirillum siberiense]